MAYWAYEQEITFPDLVITDPHMTLCSVIDVARDGDFLYTLEAQTYDTIQETTGRYQRWYLRRRSLLGEKLAEVEVIVPLPTEETTPNPYPSPPYTPPNQQPWTNHFYQPSCLVGANLILRDGQIYLFGQMQYQYRWEGHGQLNATLFDRQSIGDTFWLAWRASYSTPSLSGSVQFFPTPVYQLTLWAECVGWGDPHYTEGSDYVMHCDFSPWTFDLDDTYQYFWITSYVGWDPVGIYLCRLLLSATDWIGAERLFSCASVGRNVAFRSGKFYIAAPAYSGVGVREYNASGTLLYTFQFSSPTAIDYANDVDMVDSEVCSFVQHNNTSYSPTLTTAIATLWHDGANQSQPNWQSTMGNYVYRTIAWGSYIYSYSAGRKWYCCGGYGSSPPPNYYQGQPAIWVFGTLFLGIGSDMCHDPFGGRYGIFWNSDGLLRFMRGSGSAWDTPTEVGTYTMEYNGGAEIEARGDGLLRITLGCNDPKVLSSSDDGLTWVEET